MEQKPCPNCKASPMLSEINDIPKQVRFVVTINLEQYMPNVMKSYSKYTTFICPKCGKLEVYLTKPAATVLPSLLPKLQPSRLR